MKIVIMGCGRVGAHLAILLDREKHQVTVVDNDAHSFRRLSVEFSGATLLGNGLDQDVLKKTELEKADAFIAVTQGDNRNIMAAQMAKHIFNVRRVLCRIYDPLRRDLYSTLGIEAVSPTIVFAQILKERLLG
ncbi:potassium channel family protein [Chloroflexota bacterium]